jgi:enoyl-CoA hydratase/carnithine racemase
MMTEINTVLAAFDADPTIGAVVLTGSDKAFAGMCLCTLAHLFVCLSVCL